MLDGSVPTMTPVLEAAALHRMAADWCPGMTSFNWTMMTASPEATDDIGDIVRWQMVPTRCG
jgi:hypothetical protein